MEGEWLVDNKPKYLCITAGKGREEVKKLFMQNIVYPSHINFAVKYLRIIQASYHDAKILYYSIFILFAETQAMHKVPIQQ